MNKEKLIASLIANSATAWSESDKETLEGFDVNVLTKMQVNADYESDKTENEGGPRMIPKTTLPILLVLMIQLMHQ